MELTGAALWLNETFYGLDAGLLGLYHSLAESLGTVLTPLMKLITLLGEKGIVFFLLALFFILFARTRDLGVCIFGAVCCGALITNIILKDTICRPRPFETVERFTQWWQFVGAPAEDGFSFPSGHVTATAAGMTAIACMKGKRWIAPAAIVTAVMALSRNYLMAHYPTDVLAAMAIGCASGFIAWGITLLIFKILRDHYELPLFELVLDIDLGEFLPLERVPVLSSLSSAATKPAPTRASARSRRGEDDWDDGQDEDLPREGRRAKSLSLPTRPGAYRGKHEKR